MNQVKKIGEVEWIALRDDFTVQNYINPYIDSSGRIIYWIQKTVISHYTTSWGNTNNIYAYKCFDINLIHTTIIISRFIIISIEEFTIKNIYTQLICKVKDESGVIKNIRYRFWEFYQGENQHIQLWEEQGIAKLVKFMTEDLVYFLNWNQYDNYHKNVSIQIQETYKKYMTTFLKEIELINKLKELLGKDKFELLEKNVLDISSQNTNLMNSLESQKRNYEILLDILSNNIYGVHNKFA